ncbi:MAG: multiheme c-type cytochrome [Lysobacterales bacterium]
MWVRNIRGETRAVLTGFMMLATLCMVFFGGTCAAQTKQTADTAQAAVSEEPVADAVVKDAATLRIEATQEKNEKCLRCHKREKTKLLEDGKELSLQVPRDPYLASAHGVVSCVSCHRAIGKIKHPSKSTNIEIPSEREFSVEMNETCRKCHREKYTQYKGSVHAALVAQGNTKAPLCSGCHNPHAPESKAAFQADMGMPCKKCHEGVYQAYAASVHGQARLNGNTIRDSHIQAPICMDCHHSHEVTGLAIGDVLRTTCIACHENVILLHNQWLPNAGTHLDIVSCAVCHAPFAKRKFDLHLYDNKAGVPLAMKEGDAPIEAQLQAIEDEGVTGDPLEIWKSRGGLSREGLPADISLRSRMEVMSGVAAHQIASKSFAVRTCESCHEPGWRQKQNVTLSVPTPEGGRMSFETDREVLSSVKAADSISDFYALGGNPNKILDYLLLLSLAAGIAVPIGHFTLGKMIKEYMERGEK